LKEAKSMRPASVPGKLANVAFTSRVASAALIGTSLAGGAGPGVPEGRGD